MLRIATLRRQSTAVVAVLAVALASALSFAAVGCGGSGERRDMDGEEPAIEAVAAMAACLREGDVVFRRGGGLVSRAVLAADKGGVYSHVGIAARVNGEMVVVHAVPGEPDTRGVRDVTKMECPGEFFAPDKASRGAVMRLCGVEDGGARIAGTGDSVRSAATVLRAVRAAVRIAEAAVPFDHRYDLSDTTRMYCTELVWHVFRTAGVDLTDGRRTAVNLPGLGGEYIMPSDIQTNPNLTLILNF